MNASERLNKLGDPSLSGANSASKWLLTNKIVGDLDQRTAQLAQLSTVSRTNAKALLAKATGVVDDVVVQDAKK
jgi:hypothetical protein